MEFPAADPFCAVADADAPVPFASVANVYLSLTAETQAPDPAVAPIANIPTVPTAPPAALAPKPNPWAEIAPLVIIAGILSSLKLRLRSKYSKGCACCFYNGVCVNIHA